MVMDPNGPLIGYAWFEQLEAENARLKADYEVIEKHLRFHIEQESLRRAGEVLHQQNIESGAYNREKNETIERLKTELERLRKDTSMMLSVYSKHYERLRKAGDALVGEGETMAHEVSWVPYTWDNLVCDWNAAKEGKPSV